MLQAALSASAKEAGLESPVLEEGSEEAEALEASINEEGRMKQRKHDTFGFSTSSPILFSLHHDSHHSCNHARGTSGWTRDHTCAVPPPG